MRGSKGGLRYEKFFGKIGAFAVSLSIMLSSVWVSQTWAKEYTQDEITFLMQYDDFITKFNKPLNTLISDGWFIEHYVPYSDMNGSGTNFITQDVSIAKLDLNSLNCPASMENLRDKANVVFNDIIKYMEMYSDPVEIYQSSYQRTVLENHTGELNKCYSDLTQDLYETTNNGDGIVKDGRTLVPVRGVFESLGFRLIIKCQRSAPRVYCYTAETINDKCVVKEILPNFYENI